MITLRINLEHLCDAIFSPMVEEKRTASVTLKGTQGQKDEVILREIIEPSLTSGFNFPVRKTEDILRERFSKIGLEVSSVNGFNGHNLVGTAFKRTPYLHYMDVAPLVREYMDLLDLSPSQVRVLWES